MRINSLDPYNEKKRSYFVYVVLAFTLATFVYFILVVLGRLSVITFKILFKLFKEHWGWMILIVCIILFLWLKNRKKKSEKRNTI